MSDEIIAQKAAVAMAAKKKAEQQGKVAPARSTKGSEFVTAMAVIGATVLTLVLSVWFGR